MLDNLSFDIIEHGTTNSNFERGRQLFQNGHVKNLRILGPNFVSARVKGNKLYKVLLEYKNDSIKTYCDCLYRPEGQCKHQVAVKLSLLDIIKNSSLKKQKTTEKITPLRIYHMFIKNIYKFAIRINKGIFQ
jgi:uncharacterized Zn finger protein